MNKHSRAKIVFAILFLSLLSATQSWSADYDLVVLGGRVIDPQTKLDQISNIGISGGTIKQITADSISGKTTIDAAGQVVAPGFIDIHSHTPTLLGQHMNLLDGVTTQLDLEAGAFPISAYGEHFQGGAQLNYGSSVGHFAIRAKVIEGIDQPYLFHKGKVAKFSGAAMTKHANPAQIAEMRKLLNQGIDQGGLGIGVLLDYITDAVNADELVMLFDVASKRDVPLFIHVRRGYTGDPAGLVEVIELAKQSKAALLVCHITHLAMGRIDEWLTMIDQANVEGANITTETLSYAAGGTSISADVFQNRDWRKIFDIDYEDVQWVATGEWLTKETWDKYSKEQPRGMINHHYVKEAWIERALQWQNMMVSTDALPALDRDVFSNPNIAGTFSRVLGHYVRDAKVLGLSDGLSKLSLKQAQWMQQASPVFSKKGRIQVGMDADIVIFDAATVAANATYGDPYQAPTGINHVIVAGRQIVIDGKRIEGRYPGRKILSTAAMQSSAAMKAN